MASAVSGVADRIRSFLHFSVPDEGPLADMESWMPDFMQGLANGITTNTSLVTAAAENLSTTLSTSITNSMRGVEQAYSKSWAAISQTVKTGTAGVSAAMRSAWSSITTSSIFSVITHRSFTTLIRKSVGNSYGNEEKLSDLLERLGLADRMTTKIEDAENINDKAIDYAKVDELLKAHREVAKEYLRSNLDLSRLTVLERNIETQVERVLTASAAIVVCACVASKIVNRKQAHPLIIIGDMSYAIYLLHNPWVICVVALVAQKVGLNQSCQLILIMVCGIGLPMLVNTILLHAKEKMNNGYKNELP